MELKYQRWNCLVSDKKKIVLRSMIEKERSLDVSLTLFNIREFNVFGERLKKKLNQEGRHFIAFVFQSNISV